MHAFIKSLGYFAPGLEQQEKNESILLGLEDWVFRAPSKLVADMLPANERRRTTPLIKLALHVAKSAIMNSGEAAKQVASVFASSDGDLEIVHKLCSALSESENAISPTQFHNSVHNAPAGYWAISAATHAPSVSISAADASFAAGLLEGVIQVITSGRDVLLVVYDYPPPAPLDQKRDITMPFGIAMLLSNTSSESTLASLHIQPEECISSSYNINQCQNSSLDKLRKSNPAAYSLPLLEAIIRGQNKDIVLPYIKNQNLKLNVKS